MESIDLMRKFFLAGVIFIMSPDSRLQLWFGKVMSLFFVLLDRKLQPFEMPICGAVQFAVHLQLLVMYLTADLFFVEDADMSRGSVASEYASDNALSIGLIAANSAAFILIFLASYRGLRRIAVELSGEQLKWSNGSALYLEAPTLRPAGDGSGWAGCDGVDRQAWLGSSSGSLLLGSLFLATSISGGHYPDTNNHLFLAFTFHCNK